MAISKPNPAKVAADRSGAAGGAIPPAVAPSDAVGDDKPRRGRPPGSKTKSKSDIAEAPKKTLEEIKNEASVCTFLFATLWDISTTFTGRRKIEDKEAQKVGEALAPVLAKYLPGLSGYGLELNLVLVLSAVWFATEPPPEKPEEIISGEGNGVSPISPGVNRLKLEE